MLLQDSPYVGFGNIPVKEVWLNYNRVWPGTTACYAWVRKPLTTTAWLDIEYGSVNTLTVVGVNTYSYSTNNGDTWSSPAIINPATGNEFYNTLAYGNNTWSIIEIKNGVSVNCYTSSNILTGWTQYSINPQVSAVQFFDAKYSTFYNRFIAVGDQGGRTDVNNNIFATYSIDGINWLSAGYYEPDSVTPITAPNGFGSVTIGTNMPNKRMVACGSGGGHKFAYSDFAGEKWIRGTYNPGAIGQNLASGCAWVSVTYGDDGGIVLPANGRYVAVGGGSSFKFAYSDDGIGWVGVSYSAPELNRNWTCVTYANGKFVALSESDGYQAVSRDGKNWSACQNMPSTVRYNDVTPANNRFIAVLNNEAGNTNAVVASFV
jgi:hypothetical protein